MPPQSDLFDSISDAEYRPKVLVIPGMLGSNLHYRHWSGLQRRLWLNLPALAGGSFGMLALPLPDQEDLPGAREPLDLGFPLPEYYGGMIDFLRTMRLDVAVVAADWRRGLAHDAAIVANWILAQNGAEPITIVCHSRGGMLTRAALVAVAAAGELGESGA